MKYFFSRLQNILLRQVLIVFLIASTFLGFISYGNNIAVAQADVKTPEGIYYKGTPDGNNGQVDNAQSNLKGAVNNVREKLNLDEPIPQSTKRFFKSAERRTEKAVEPLTKTPEGYYQTPQRSR
ncbi:hypothetical protein I8751_26760 [Nostocaceae cyanobacterium CENA357]|uniref:Uncharacterized protein n=1 Tax=Atlanticothrix silvestris CENA357 TaxID=1725252 RepID=A0A8J7L5B6_9CYAN|nr:hypothetical protein [Atlanticothrix silvestris]MBH8555879.1 hypothetical protein [Atlanticothrix silvestris CENA357]